MTTEELFNDQMQKHWDRLRNNSETLFENTATCINFNKEFDKFKDSPAFMEVVSESDLYTKKRILESYFWSDIIAPLYEATFEVLEKAGLVEESMQSFENSYKFENTARLILENGIFSSFPLKKELTDELIEMFFYPSDEIIEEGFSETGRKVIDAGRAVWTLMQLLGYILVSPATSALNYKSDSPTSRKMVNLLALLLLGGVIGSGILGGVNLAIAGAGAVGIKSEVAVGVLATLFGLGGKFAAMKVVGLPGEIWKFINEDLVEITKYLSKVNKLGGSDSKAILQEIGINPKELITKCWERNNHQLPANDDLKNGFSKLIRAMSNGANSIRNLIRDPYFSNNVQLALSLKRDASDPKYQKMFYDFRVCMYDKIFEVIIGYAQMVYSVDDASYEIIRHANQVHRRKNFKAFFALDPKTDSEVAMFKLIKLLIVIEDMIIKLEEHKRELVADKFIDQFIQHMKMQIKNTYTTLDEMAQLRSYNKARYDEEQPTDEEKAEAIQKARNEAKRSIFS